MFNIPWKPESKYVIRTAGFMKNGMGSSENVVQFRARPLKLYRRQYQENPSTRYSLASASIIDTPASYNLNLVEHERECNGITLAPNHMLSSNENQRNACCPIAKRKNGAALVMSNRQRLYKKFMTYDQNMPKNNVSKFRVGDVSCPGDGDGDQSVTIHGYVKNTNRKFQTTSAVTSSARILRQKEDAIRYTIVDHENKNYDTYCLAKRHKCKKN